MIFKDRKQSSLMRLGGSFNWDVKKREHPEEKFSTEIFVGAKGAGKSLLAIHRLRMYYEGKRRDKNGFCLCGDKNCDARWRIITNLESPSLDEYGAWTERLDLQEHLIDVESTDRHVILYIDEITQYFNSRHAMMKQVIQMINNATLIRKKLIRLWGSGINFDWIERRIREQTSVVYNCWSTNQGESVNAIVTNLHTGNKPPWMKTVPQIKRWWTGGSRRFYNTDEMVNAEVEFAQARNEPIVYVEENGNAIEKELGEILAEVLALQIMQKRKSITVDELVKLVDVAFGVPISTLYAREWLSTQFMRDKTGRYILIVEKSVAVAQ